MKVEELRQALHLVDGDAEVVIYLPEFCKPGSEIDYMRYIDTAKFQPSGSINNKEFEITAGKGFGY